MARPRKVERVTWVWSAATLALLLAALGLYLHPVSRDAWGGLARPYRYWSGVGVAALVAGVMAFTIRKWVIFLLFAYFLRPRPGTEEQLDQAVVLVGGIQEMVDRGAVTNRRDIRERVAKALADTGVDHSMTYRLEKKPLMDRTVPRIRLVRREPFGRLHSWLRVHIFFGLLGFFLALLHADFRLGGFVAGGTLLLFLATTLTGLLGAWLYWTIPARLTKLESQISYAETRRQLEKLEEGLEELVAASSENLKTALRPYYASRLSGLARKEELGVVALRQMLPTVDPKEREEFERGLTILSQCAKLEAYYGPQRQEKRKLELWLAFHIPVAVAMLVFLAFHVLSIAWY